MNHRPQLSVVLSAASPEEAAVVAAAIEQFARATAPPPAPVRAECGRWQQAALHEGVLREPGLPLPWT